MLKKGNGPGYERKSIDAHNSVPLLGRRILDRLAASNSSLQRISKIGKTAIPVPLTFAKNMSRRPASVMTRSQSALITASSVASAWIVVTLKRLSNKMRSEGPSCGIMTNLNFTIFTDNCASQVGEIISSKIQEVQVLCTLVVQVYQTSTEAATQRNSHPPSRAYSKAVARLQSSPMTLVASHESTKH